MALANPLKPIPTAHAETNTNNENVYKYLCSVAEAVNDLNLAIDGELMSDVNAEIREQTDNRFVSTAEIAEAVMNLQDGTDSYAQAYSASPNRVGTWIDGTPIWRAAFSVNCGTDMDSEDYEVTLLDKLFIPRLPLNDTNTKLLLLGAFCVYTSNTEYPLRVDDYVLELEYANNFPQFVLPQFLLNKLPDEWSADMTDGFYGWVEFATPESNISANA